MTDLQDQAPTTAARPRVALMGEFSAGKSTLTNLLLGADPLPVKITATRLPPVWITQGTGPAMRENIEGDILPLGPDGLNGVQIEDTRLIRLEMQSDILALCDLVDMPGISDPNMDAQVWRDVIDQADLVVWCTHATQAWRQSEAAAFDSLPQPLKDKAILLITRFDKLHSDRDRARVMARVRAETKGQFRNVFPVALLNALAAGEDRSRWEASGAEPFIKTLIDMITSPDAQGDVDDETLQDPSTPPAQTAEISNIAAVRPVRVAPPGGIRRARPTDAKRRSIFGNA